MLFGTSDVAFYAMLLACFMHVFIFFCGMGPFRWNIMTLYMLVCCIYFADGPNDFRAPEKGRLIYTSEAYLVLFGFVIPVIGLLQPITLGRYFGGYRMATFHFAGNDAYRALLIRRDAIPCAPAEGSRAQSVYGELLRQRASAC